MATINLGAIKFNWKGAYNSGTAYAVDDVVSSSGNSYVCIQAHTNQAVGNATAYWNIMSSAGTDGTDVGATLNNKEIAFKTNAGAVDGIPIGTAGQFLKVNSGATGYEYGAVSSDFVKIAEQSSNDLGATSFQFNNCFDDSIYKSYELFVRYNQQGSNAARLIARFLDGSNNEVGASGANYFRAGYQAYVNSSNNTHGTWNSHGRNDFDIFNWANHTTDAVFNMAHWQISGDLNSTSHYPTMIGMNTGKDDSGTPYFFTSFGGFTFQDLTDLRGIKFFSSDSENLEHVECQLYGRK